MKKAFIEPKLRRIELNINENIANSNQGKVTYTLQTEMTQMCLIEDTDFSYYDVWFNGVTEDKLISCAVYVQSRRQGVTYVTRQELFGY